MARQGIFELDARMHRTENIVKGYEAIVRLVLIPSELFKRQSRKRQEEIIDEMHLDLSLQNFRVDSDGDVRLLSEYWRQWVTVVVNDDRSTWEYDGGEVNVLATSYDGLERA